MIAKRKTSLFKTLEKAVQNLFAAVTRVVLIFLLLSIGFDSMTRIYYSYMPVETWMDFQSVTVQQSAGEAVAILRRNPKGQTLSVFHRTLLIRYPEERRGCTNSTVTIIEDPTVPVVVVPLERLLSATCPDLIGPNQVDAVLQISYIFEFPYGVKRLAVRLSNRFSLQYQNGKYVVGQPTLPFGTR